MPNNTKRHASDAEIGIAWWNAMTERQRLAALLAVEREGRASPAEAFDHWRFGFKCEETAHG
jgi:hypothetical protein